MIWVKWGSDHTEMLSLHLNYLPPYPPRQRQTVRVALTQMSRILRISNYSISRTTNYPEALSYTYIYQTYRQGGTS